MLSWGGASTGVWDGGSAQRTVGPLARREMEDAVTSLAHKYFAGLFQVQDTKKVGAPSKDRIERERAVGVLLHTNCPLTEGDGFLIDGGLYYDTALRNARV